MTYGCGDEDSEHPPRLTTAFWEACDRSAELKERVTVEVDRLDQETQRIAAGGARIDAVGLFAVAIGTALQVLGTLLEYTAPVGPDGLATLGGITSPRAGAGHERDFSRYPFPDTYAIAPTKRAVRLPLSPLGRSRPSSAKAVVSGESHDLVNGGAFDRA